MGVSKSPFLCQEKLGILDWEKSLLFIFCSAASELNTVLCVWAGFNRLDSEMEELWVTATYSWIATIPGLRSGPCTKAPPDEMQ